MKDTLNISIHSFGYKKSGIPQDETENNGGFVFDCRGLPNPGRLEAYKKSTGLEENVRNYLESYNTVKEFVELAISIVQINIDNYVERDFTHLMINFGCTGGQHRSVYCADQVYKYLLKNGYQVTITHQDKPEESAK